MNEKILKAIEIIKKKGVCMFLLHETKTYEYYNEFIDNYRGCDDYLTEEEYKILKEVLDDEN